MDTITIPIPSNRGPSSRKGAQLPPIQTSFAVSPTQRIRPPNDGDVIPSEPFPKLLNVDEKPLALRHQDSKGGLLALFRRMKMAKNGNILEDPNTSVEGTTNIPTPPSKETQLVHDSARLSLTQETTATVSRPRTLQRQPSKPVAKSKSIKRELNIRTPTTWDPPPLFQAYPQAIKYASLRAPTISTNTILRASSDPKDIDERQNEIQSTADSEPIKANINWGKRKGYPRRKSKHNSTQPIPEADWVHKLYILVTSGYFLQYAGEGSFDRLPEKIMALSKDSAAFASDAISGEHWVLQVSQSSDVDGLKGNKDPGSIMKKIGFLRDSRRSTSSFLLTLDSPEDLDSWLKVVRGEIESMGGKKYCPNEGAPAEGAFRGEHEKLSHRYSIRSPGPSFRAVNRDGKGPKSITHLPPISAARRGSAISQISADSPAVSNRTISSNQRSLDQLRTSRRMSYASTGAKTLSTSRGSSPGPSPSSASAKPDFPFHDHRPNLDERNIPVRKVPQARRALAQNSSRKSSDPSSASRSTSRSASQSPRPLSTSRSHSGHTTPAAAPNFSVPTFSKRNSMVNRVPLSSTSEDIRSPMGDAGAPIILSSPEKDPCVESGESVFSLPPSKSLEVSSPKKKSRPLPRRLSSLQYSRGIAPHHLPANQLLSPHPPPSNALSAVPGYVSAADEKDTIGTMSQKRSLRRPLSMHVRTDPIARINHHQVRSMAGNKPGNDDSPETLSETHAEPPCGITDLPRHRSKMLNRRSVPDLEMSIHSMDSLPPLPNVPYNLRITLTNGD